MAIDAENAAKGSSIQEEDETGGFLDNMEYRGGGYAILRALWDAHEKGLASLSVSQICQRAKQWCSHHMDHGLFAGRQLGLGWDAHGSLLKHGILEKQKLKARKPRDRIEAVFDLFDFWTLPFKLRHTYVVTYLRSMVQELALAFY